MIFDYGQLETADHKAWCLDQVAQILADAPDYENRVTTYQDGEDGPETYLWDQGSRPEFLGAE